MENCNENGFWSWLEVEMDDNLGEEDNKLLSLIGIIVGHVGILAVIMAGLWPLFRVGGGSGTLGWAGYLYLSFGAIALAFMVWGLILWIFADSDTNEATVFRAWRTNFLAQVSGALVSFLMFVLFFIYSFTVGGGLSDYYSMGYFIGAFVFGGVAVYMMFFLKGWWYNIDEAGHMRCDEDWNLSLIHI